MEKMIRVEDVKKGDIIKPFKSSRPEPKAGSIEIEIMSDPKTPTSEYFADIFLEFDIKPTKEYNESELLLRLGEFVKKC